MSHGVRASIAALTHDDVADVVRAHIALQHAAYAHLADGGHAAALWGSHDARVADLHAEVDAADAARGQGREPEALHLVARSERGAVVGLAAAFRGVGEWEHHVFGDAWRPSGTDWCLDSLYLMPGARRANLGQRLLDAAVPAGRPAYLWVIADNAGAIRFYERNGFRHDGLRGRSGPDWGDLDMLRMVRGEQGESTD
ncbi:MAG: GNAT family N-acetyltransferase [Propionibacteriaceae bacterium]|nr:GNAT family N-acetyltransferase [Propionibacteriaceae bacterium]